MLQKPTKRVVNKLTPHRVNIRRLILVTVGLLNLSCTPSVRQFTYPPSFKYISDDQLKSTMWRLAAHMSELEQTLSQNEHPNSNKRESTLNHLSRIETLMQGLTLGEDSHPLLGRYAPQLLEAVRRAKAGVSLENPSYFSATQVSATCNNCHGHK